MMKRLILLLFLLLPLSLGSPTPARAAFGSVGTLGTVAVDATATSIVLTTSAQCDAANICICQATKFNAAASSAETNEITAFADSTGANTWAKLKEYTQTPADPNEGLTSATYWTKAVSSIASGGTITATLSDSRTSRTMSCWEFTVGAGKTIAIAAGGSGVGFLITAGNSNSAQSMALAGLPSKEYLFFRGQGCECESGTSPTATASWTGLSLASSTDHHAWGEFRILTATGVTSDPTGGGGVSRTYSSQLYALEEVDVAAPPVFRRGVIIIQ